MVTIQIEHAIPGFEAWKAAFDRDPIDRAGSGVRAYRVFRPVDDEKRIVVELDVDDVATGEAVREKLIALWTSAAAAPVALEEKTARLLELVEQVEL